MYDRLAVGRRLKSLRVDQGIDQATLSAASGIDQGLLSSYETGKTVMGFDKACQIADALGCSLDKLACREEV